MEENWTATQILFEQSSDSSSESVIPECKTPFMNHKEDEGVFINPRWFGGWWSKGQKYVGLSLDLNLSLKVTLFSFTNWASALLTNPDFWRKSHRLESGKPWICRKLLPSTEADDMEFLISWWSVGSHIFKTLLGEFCPTLFLVLIGLPLFKEARKI